VSALAAPARQGADASQGALHALRSAPAAATGRMVAKMALSDSPGSAPALVPHVLALDDDPSVRQLVHDYLVENELRCTAVATGSEFDQVMTREAIDVVVLDVRLQGEDGLQIARRLRETSTIPILMLTGRAEEADRVMGLELGADDYFTKPFSPRELLARVSAVLRRVRPALAGERLAYADIEMDTASHRVRRAGSPVMLGPTEFRLLKHFLEHPGRVFSRERLLDSVWGRDSDIEPRTVDVHIRRLRKAINIADAPDVIRTVRSAGYALDSENAV